MRAGRIEILALAGALAVALLGGGCTREPAREEAVHPVVAGVTIATAALADVAEYAEVSGTVEARVRSVVASRVMGAVTSVMVREGDRVRRGDLLVTIDDRDLKEKARAAEEGLRAAGEAAASAHERMKLAEATYRRYEALHSERAVSDQEFDEVAMERRVAGSELDRALAGRTAAEAMRDEARLYLAYARVTAPASGVVTIQNPDVGSMASPGMPLLEIESAGPHEVRAAVDAGYIEKVRAGMPVRVRVEALGIDIAGNISEVVRRVDPATRTFTVKVALDDERLGGGLYAKVAIPVGERTGIFVPEGAVRTRGQLTGVYRVDGEGILSFGLVRTGAVRDGMVEVLAGLAAGDRYVAAGIANAVDGGKVE
jgi:RND family efflux transporter MFP subunit